jgi:hypothetical protein
MDLQIHPDRESSVDEDVTGIFIRARTARGKWHSCDISCLTKESLLKWLRADPGAEDRLSRTEAVVCILLGHNQHPE